MAIEKTVKLNVDTNSAVSAMGNLSKATHDVSQSFEQVYGELQPLTTRMGEAEDRLYELANAGKTTTKEYKDLLKSVGDYRKVQINTDLAVDSAASTMGQKLGGALSGVTSGFSIATGLMGTFGAESEEVEILLLRVNSAMALTQGVQGIREAIPMFREMGQAAKLALNGIKTGLAATGIGLLVVGLGLLITYWDDITGATEDSTKAADDYAKKQKEITANVKQESSEVSKSSAAYSSLIYQLKGTNQGSRERSELITKINNQYGATLKNLSDENEFQEQLNKSVEAYIALKRNEFRIKKNDELIQKGLEKQYNLEKKLDEFRKNAQTGEWSSFKKTDKGDFDPVMQQKAVQAELDELNVRMSGYGLNINSLNKNQDKLTEGGKRFVATNREVAKSVTKVSNAVVDAANAEKKAAEEANKFKKEAETEFLNQIEAIQEENWQNTLTQQEREEQAVATKYFTIEQLAIGNAEQLAIIETAKNAELKVITDKAAADKLVADEKKAAADKEIADKDISTAKAVAEQKAAIQSQGIDTALQGVQLIKGLFEKQKGVQKAAVIAESAIGIAKMIIANKLANIGALATPQAILSSGASAVPVIAMNNISTGIGIAANIAATGKALQSLGGGSPPPDPNIGGGGGGSAGGQQQAPQFNVVGNSGINQLAQIQQQPTQAYVVSGAVTSAQSLDRNRVQNATIG